MPSALLPSPPFLGRVGGDAAGQLERHVDRRSRDLEHRHRDELDALADADAVRAHQHILRRRAEAAIGGPLDPAAGISSRVVRTSRAGSFDVETVVVEDDRGVRIPVTTISPSPVGDAPRPGVLVIPGHSPRTWPRTLDLAAEIASAGVVVAVMESWGQGERSDFRTADGSSALDLEPDDILPVLEHNCGGAACWAVGDSLARHMVQDARVVLAHLGGRPDVDERRTGVTGASGGGLLTAWLMLLEPGIAAAAPLIFLTDQARIRDSGIPQCAEQIALGDGASWLDHVDALVAMAPRPVLVGSGDFDFFPIDGAVATTSRARRAYELLGAGDALRHARFDVGHDVPRAMASEVAAFFARSLGAEGEPRAEAVDWSAHALLASEGGLLYVEDPAQPRVLELARGRFEERAGRASVDTARAWLRERTAREPGGEDRIRWTGSSEEELDGIAVRRREGFWPVDEGVAAAGVLLEPKDGAEELVLALFEEGTADLARHASWVRDQLAEGRGVVAVDVRGTGSVLPRARNWFPLQGDYGTLYELTANLLRLGDSLAAGRISDVLTSVRLARRGHRLHHVESWGSANGYALPAAFLDETLHLVTHGGVWTPETLLEPTGCTDPRQWQHIIPGMAVHVPDRVVRHALEGRWRRADVPSRADAPSGAETPRRADASSGAAASGGDGEVRP